MWGNLMIFFRSIFKKEKWQRNLCIRKDSTSNAKKRKKNVSLSWVHAAGNEFFKLSGKICKFCFVFLSISCIRYWYRMSLLILIFSFWGKQIDLFFMAFWVGALLLKMTLLARSLYGLFASSYYLVGLSFINIPCQLLECNVPLSFCSLAFFPPI